MGVAVVWGMEGWGWGRLTDNTPVLLELETFGTEHNHSQAVQVVIVAEAELEVTKLRGRLGRRRWRHPLLSLPQVAEGLRILSLL